MIVYSEPKARFCNDVVGNLIAERIERLLLEKRHMRTGGSEFRSWQNSMQYMGTVLSGPEIPDDAQVSIEYSIPQTSKRIDVIVSGRDENDCGSAVIIELKQWEKVERTKKDAIVSTFLGGAQRETQHPSYQAWTYAALLRDFNETVQTEGIGLYPCAYLHNCKSADTIRDDFYAEHLERAPAFLKTEALRLRAFIAQHVRRGDRGDLMYRIENGRIRPSKALADSLVSMLAGNREFLLIDEQKLAHETAIEMADVEKNGKKRVLVVEGGPGTGKSVVAINLLVELTARQRVVKYVSRNAAPRDVYAAKLTGSYKKSHIDNLFCGSGQFTETEPDSFDALIVDEAHRLNEKSGLYKNQGVNQIREVISAAHTSIFFIDEDQRVTIHDIGTKEDILKWAAELGAETKTLELASQFRCNGSDGYLAWLDNVLQIRSTANTDLSGIDYDFRVCASPTELRERIFEANRESNKARLVAGYCWDWKSKKDSAAYDIELENGNFRMQWNLGEDGNLWIVKPESVKQVGCIHTCQGLELDYVGVIIGPDLVVRDNLVATDPTRRSSQDSSVRGLKKMLREDPENARKLGERVVKNTYRTLMSRGMKGCFVYCTDAETQRYFEGLTGASAGLPPPPAQRRYEGLPVPLVDASDVEPYVNAVPLFDLRIAAGEFGEGMAVEECDWVQLPEPMKASPGYFVARVNGESMNRMVPNGAWCLFRRDPGGTRQGKIVLVQHQTISDPALAGGMTLKRYQSEKEQRDDGTWVHSRIVLKPESLDPGFREIVLEPSEAEELRILGELVAILR